MIDISSIQPKCLALFLKTSLKNFIWYTSPSSVPESSADAQNASLTKAPATKVSNALGGCFRSILFGNAEIKLSINCLSPLLSGRSSSCTQNRSLFLKCDARSKGCVFAMRNSSGMAVKP